MIKDKKDYFEYCREDEKAIKLNKTNKISRFFNPIWKYEHALRKDEYFSNCCNHIWQKPIKAFYRYKHVKLGIKYGFSIPINVFGKGLSIAHVGTIVVNSGALIGDYCRIHVCTCIGTEAGKTNNAPIIGNRVYIGPGAKIYGSIKIGNNIAIGANSVVNKNFEQDGITIAGIPAKQISNKGSFELL